MWLEDATGTTYIGSRDTYYIDDYGNLRNIPNQKLLPPPGILQKNTLNQKSVANFICGLDSLLMIRSENPCLKKKVISSNVP